jgi:hypothetical protein
MDRWMTPSAASCIGMLPMATMVSWSGYIIHVVCMYIKLIFFVWGGIGIIAGVRWWNLADGNNSSPPPPPPITTH